MLWPSHMLDEILRASPCSVTCESQPKARSLRNALYKRRAWWQRQSDKQIKFNGQISINGISVILTNRTSDIIVTQLNTIAGGPINAT